MFPSFSALLLCFLESILSLANVFAQFVYVDLVEIVSLSLLFDNVLVI